MPQQVAAVRLDIPVSTIEPYQKEADSRHVPLVDVVKATLKRCQNHRAARPLYFNDEQRGQLEHLLGGACEDADGALSRISGHFTIKVGGVDIKLSAYDLRRLKARLRKDKPFEEELQWLMTKILQRFLQGEI